MNPRRYRILLWAVPIFVLQWVAIMVIEPSGDGTDEYMRVGFFFGSIFGHVALSAAWAALGPGRIRWRIPLSLVWVASLPALVAINLGLDSPPASGIALTIGASLLGQWLLTQLLLWPLAVGYNLRLRYLPEGEETPDRRERQFSVRELMVTTAIIGVLFGAGRGLVGWLGTSYPDDLFLAYVFLAVVAVLYTVPLLLAGLLPKHAIPAVLAVLMLICLGTAWEATLLEIFTEDTSADTGHFVGVNAFIAATILVGVLILRLNAYGVGTPGKVPAKGGAA